MKKIKVLIIDDSALVRQMLTEMLNSSAYIEVVGVAADPIIAKQKISSLKPDVLTLDVEMPRMDGITFLANLMRIHPMPVIMVSSLTDKGADITMQALELGAIDFVSKPKIDIALTLNEYADEVIGKILVAAKAKVRPNYQETASTSHKPELTVNKKFNADAIIEPSLGKKRFKTTDQIIAIGASTGGTEAIKEILMSFPPDSPGTVVTQHIPITFSGAFARRLDGLCDITVYEARHGQQILPGHAYVAPGDKHLLVKRDGARYVCHLNDGPPVNRHIPSIDVMFRSVAQNAGPNAKAIILTGMGKDGALGINEMHDAGAYTIAQDEKSSVIWSMPSAAIKTGGIDDILTLSKIAKKIHQNTNS